MKHEYGSLEYYAEMFADFLADVQADDPDTGDNLVAGFKLALSDWKDYYQKQTAECARLLKKIDEEIWIQKRAVRLYRQAARQADCQTNTNIDIKLCTMQN